MSMRPFVKVITLGVEDLERSLTFYRDGMGLPTQGIVGTEFEHGAVVFFHLQGGQILALYPKEHLAIEANIPHGGPSSVEISLGNMAGSRDEVDRIMVRAERAGAVVTDPARDRFFGGYSGYFQDPDDHLWEIFWNADFEIKQ